MPPEVDGFRCPTCGRNFGASLGLELHGVRVHRQRGIAEGTGAPTASPNLGPGKEEDPDPVRCERCSGWFADSEDLSQHVERHHAPTPEPEPPSEDAVVREVADSLPSSGPIAMFGSDRLSRTRGLLSSARRKAARDSDADADEVIRKFWDGSDRKVLEALRSKGVDILGRKADRVEGGTRVG